MNRTVSGLCAAAAFGLAATLGAQSTTTSSRPDTTASAKVDREVTIIGCLSKGTSGGYVLTDARMDKSPSSGTGSTTTAGTIGTGGETPASAPAMTWMLSGGSDLEKHRGHKIQVTGKTSWNGSMEHGRTSTTSASGTGTTAAPATTTGPASDHPRLDVKSIKMVSSSCP